MANTNNTWRFQHDDGSISMGSATDARGLRLRKECGYGWVKMEGTADAGWLQISVAIRKLESREAVARILAAA